MAGDMGTIDTITVPYSGEIKKGLLIIVKYIGQVTSQLLVLGTALYLSDSYFISSKYGSSETDIRIDSVSLSNGVLTIEVFSGGWPSYEVAFLQLNLD